MAQEQTEKTGEKLAEGSDLVRESVVKVYATDKAIYVAEGEVMEVHPLLAEKLIKSGKATKSKPKAKEDK